MARTNDAVAEALAEYADLLAMTGGDQFKVRVYEKAARSVASYASDIDTLDEDSLDDIPGVGKSIAAKILECETHGSFAELDELRAHVPAGVRALLSIPGLGPKRAMRLHEELGISSVSELLDALHDHRLAGVKGFGAKTEQNLVAGIEQMRAAGGRLPLAVALDVADEMLQELRGVPEVISATYAGSLRRMAETIGDIDLLVSAEHAAPVMEAFCTLPTVASVLAHGSTKSAVLTTKGIHVDLRVVAPQSWGAALQYFTGSKAHNVRLRAIAQRHGLKLSEYGLVRTEDDSVVASETEERVYAELGVPWILPTLREDRGEVEAALAGTLPDVIEISDMRGDLHTHTNLTDGLATLNEMVTAARQRGYSYYAVTDHAPTLYMERMTSDRALEQRRKLRSVARRNGIALLHGTELNIARDGSLDWDDTFLSGFDIVVASVHSHFTLSRTEMTRRVIRAIEHPYVNIIGHPTGRLLGRRPGVELDMDAVFEAAARTGTALEINAFPDRLDCNDDLVRRAHERGVLFAVSTDAHAVPHLAYMRYGVAVAQRGWLEPERVVNTWPLERLRSFLAKPGA